MADSDLRRTAMPPAQDTCRRDHCDDETLIRHPPDVVSVSQSLSVVDGGPQP